MTRIFVHRQNLNRNLMDGGDRPVFVVASGAAVIREVHGVSGPGFRTVYDPLGRNGAHAWIEVDFPVKLDDAAS